MEIKILNYLIDYGILGIFCAILVYAVIYLFKSYVSKINETLDREQKQCEARLQDTRAHWEQKHTLLEDQIKSAKENIEEKHLEYKSWKDKDKDKVFNFMHTTSQHIEQQSKAINKQSESISVMANSIHELVTTLKKNQ